MQACWPLVCCVPFLFGIVTRCICCVGVLMTAMWGANAQADPLLDFRFFTAPQDQRHAPSTWLVNWLVRPDAQTYCHSVTHKDGFASRMEGCVYWSLGQRQCTVVTTDSTTHSQLGHLYLHCLNAH